MVEIPRSQTDEIIAVVDSQDEELAIIVQEVFDPGIEPLPRQEDRVRP